MVGSPLPSVLLRAHHSSLASCLPCVRVLDADGWKKLLARLANKTLHLRSGFVVCVGDKAWRIFENDASHREQTMLLYVPCRTQKKGLFPSDTKISGRHRCVEIRCRLLGNWSTPLDPGSADHGFDVAREETLRVEASSTIVPSHVGVEQHGHKRGGEFTYVCTSIYLYVCMRESVSPSGIRCE